MLMNEKPYNMQKRIGTRRMLIDVTYVIFDQQMPTGFMKTVPSVFILLMDHIHLLNSTQVAEGTVFRKHTVCRYNFSLA